MIADVRRGAERTFATEIIDGDLGINVTLVDASGVGWIERGIGYDREFGILLDCTLDTGLICESHDDFGELAVSANLGSAVGLVAEEHGVGDALCT